MNRKFIVVAAGATVAASGVGTLIAPPATAMTATVQTHVVWEGTNCVQLRVPSDYDSTRTVLTRVCDSSPSQGLHRVSWVKSELMHDFVGADPIMGDATRLSCSLFVENALKLTSVADRGDGRDVNCIYRLPES